MKNFALSAVAASATAFCLLVSGCGGGDVNSASLAAPATPTPSVTSTAPTTTPTAPTTTPIIPTAPVSSAATITGSILKGPVNAATVCVYKLDAAAAGKKGAQVAVTGSTAFNDCVVSAADGSYSMSLPTGTTGDLIVEASGGTYCSNEAQYDATAKTCAGSGGVPVPLSVAKLTTVIETPASGAVASAVVTPLSTSSFTNMVAAGLASAVAFRSQFTALVTATGLPSSLSAATLANDPTLQSVLANFQQIAGADPAVLNTFLTGLATGGYRYGSMGFAATPLLMPPTTPTPTPTPMPLQSAAAVISSSGSLTVTGTGAGTFTPNSAKFEVSVQGSAAQSTQYRFPLLGGSYGADLTVTTRNGETPSVAFQQFLTAASCLKNCGVTITTPAGATHPVTLTFTNTTAGSFVLNGSVVGDVSADALWSAAELPRTTTQTSVSIAGVDVPILSASVANDAASGGYLGFISLTDGRFMSVSGDGKSTPSLQLLSANAPINPVETFFNTCALNAQRNCSVSTANAGTGAITDTSATTTFTLDTTVFSSTISGKSLTVKFNSPVVIAKPSGSLTTGVLANFTPNTTSGPIAKNDTRSFGFTQTVASTSSSGNLSAISLTTRAGKVIAMTALNSDLRTQYACNEVLNAVTCNGATLAADGLTVTFANTKLGLSLGTGQPLTLNGTLVANGL